MDQLGQASTRAALGRLGVRRQPRGQNVRCDLGRQGRPAGPRHRDLVRRDRCRHRPRPHPARRRRRQQRRRARPVRRRRARGRAAGPTSRRWCRRSSGPARPPASGSHDVDAIAVTSGPGLAGALLVGVAAAKALAVGLGKPLYGVNHLAAHVAVDQLEHGPLPEPCLALLVSRRPLLAAAGRPTSRRGVEPLGATIDDAAGEAFDKVARLLGLPFPGGPHIDRAAREGQRAPRLPARADLAARPRAAPLRLLVLRSQDRRRPLGRGPSARRASRCRSPTSRRQLPGGGLRRAGPQGARRRRRPRASRTS